MVDATPSATPMPAQPVATGTSTEALTSLPTPLPHVVPPAVTDPVSNLDFLPVDDAFALEMRAQSIEQLAGGDALRRGVSERIEAGRSKTNADLVAGRDRVRVHATLHEHTGHGRAEQAAHLHTTVERRLDVHAASEDTVLLAGHMRDLWDGGAAIVAAMTDDTVAGGGIRVTTPFDLWLHGLMGVEERIGTCVADAVLMELGGTHYEREYGPGAHTAGLAAYAGSLYQSSRSTFRPLMRASSGVRNLIAGGGGGGGGGDAGTGSAPGASPPPAPAAGGAGTQAASETLSAATAAGGTAQAGVMAGVRSQDLTGIHRGDEVTALALGANVAGAAGDLTELRRDADTAGQLGALRDAMRGAGADAQREVRSASRVPELDDTASVHEASAPDIVADIPSGATVPDLDAPVLHSTVSPPQPPPGVKLGLLGGGGDHPPQSAAPESDFPAINRRLLELHRHYNRLFRTDIARDHSRIICRFAEEIMRRFKTFGGSTEELVRHPRGVAIPERAYLALRETARQAERNNDLFRARAISEALDAIDEQAAEALRALTAKHGIPEVPTTQATQTMQATQAMQRPPVTVASTPVATPGRLVIPVPAHPIALAFDPAFAGPPVTVASTPVATPGRLVVPVPAHPIALAFNPAFAGPPVTVASTPVTTPDRLVVPVPAHPITLAFNPAYPEPAGDLGRWRLGPPATVSGTTAARPAATEATIAPALAEFSSFWRQPADPVPRPGTVPFDYGLYHAGETVRPPPVTAPALVAALPTPSRVGVDFAVERALIADELPTGFDASKLIDEARTFEQFGLPEQLAAGRLPLQTIDILIEGFQATDVAGDNTLHIEYLRFLKESIERALHDAYPGRVHPLWLAHVRNVLRLRSELASPSAAPATSLLGLGVRPIARIPGPGAGISHSAPPPPPPALVHFRAGAVAPPPTADPSRIQPPWASGGPHPVAFDPWSAPPGPSSRVVYSETIRSPVMPISSPPEWRDDETPGFGRAASGGIELPFSQREAIVRQFGTENALLEAEYALRTGAAAALGWSTARSRWVLDDLDWLTSIVQSESVAVAAMEDVDWSAIETLARILDNPLPSP